MIGTSATYAATTGGRKVKKSKVRQTMHEFRVGTLHSGSKTGPKVTKRKQAVAIALNQARKKRGR
jgi:hypothetical protein